MGEAAIVIRKIFNRSGEGFSATRQEDGEKVTIPHGGSEEGPWTFRYDPDEHGPYPSQSELWILPGGVQKLGAAMFVNPADPPEPPEDARLPPGSGFPIGRTARP